MIFQDPVGSLSPRLSVRANPRRAVPRAWRDRATSTAKVARLLDEVGLPAILRRALSAPALRRPGAPRRRRPRAGAAAEAGHRRRADRRPRRLGPGRGAEPPERAAGDARHRAPDHHAQSQCRAPRRRPRGGHVSRPHRRGGADRRRSSRGRATAIRRRCSPPTRCPTPTRAARRLDIEGEVPSLFSRPPGCEFHPRCPFAIEPCPSIRPPFDARHPDARLRLPQSRLTVVSLPSDGR